MKPSARSRSRCWSCETNSKTKGMGFDFLFRFSTPCQTIATLTSNALFSVDEDEIDDRCDELRKKLQAERKKGGSARKEFKTHEVHSMADAKKRESERLRSALKISKDYEAGDHWRRQDERQRGGTGGDKNTKPEQESRK
jgi:hypothetical protein